MSGSKSAKESFSFTRVACFSTLKNAVALSVNFCFPLLSGPSALKQWIFSPCDPSIGNETAQASKLYFITSFGRFSQADIILSTQLHLESALIRSAVVISCSVSAIQAGPWSNAGPQLNAPGVKLKIGSFDPGFFLCWRLMETWFLTNQHAYFLRPVF